MPINLTDTYKKNSYFREIACSESLYDLQEILYGDQNLEIAQKARNPVFADGNSDAKLMIIGEAPGRDEDESGVPFYGRAGKYLDKMLEEAGLSRNNDTYITNSVNWRPDNNRVPTEEEILYCLPYLEKHISLQKPKLIVTLGATSTFALLNRSAKPEGAVMKNIILKIYKYKNYFSREEFSIFPMYHPSYMMRNHNMQDVFRSHFSQLKECMSSIISAV